MSGNKIKVLRVVAKRDSFRRAGVEFSAEPKDLPLETLSEDARQAILADPSLVAHEVEINAIDTAADEAELAAGQAAKPAAKSKK